MEDAGTGKRKGISGNALKAIAMASMLIDHLDVAVFQKSLEGPAFHMVDLGMRTIGRLAFPIFCFLLVEGFLHTKNIKKYGTRLLLFGLISEIPFDLAIFGKWYDPGYQNVFFTLFIGLWVLEKYLQYQGKPVWQSMFFLLGCGFSMFLKCDYQAMGIAFILLIYVLHEQKKLQTLLGSIFMAIESLGCFGAAALAFVPIRMYNGTRGKKNVKYFFYIFYPAHLFLLYLLHLMIIKGRIL